MPQVTIGPEFFAKARQDYSNWQWALVREFFQNCIDCRSRNISLDVRYVAAEDETVITVTNDGTAMTQDILVDKLLSLGASGKDFAGTVGGFGKAKELLYFCWKSYEITSGEWNVKGKGADYEIKKLRRSLQGTTSTIVIKGDHAAEIEEHAHFFIAVSNVRPTFTVNGIAVPCNLRSGHYRRDLRCGKVYTNRQLTNRLIVRIGGIPMYTSWAKYKHCVVIELTGTSADVLTANRDGLRYEHRTEVEGFIGDLTTNKRKALKQPVTEYFRFEGEKIKCVGMEKLAAAHDHALPSEAGILISTSALQSGDSYGRQDVTEMDTQKANAIASAFVIKNETGRKVPKDWRPDCEEFSKYAYRIATIWSRLLIVLHRVYGASDEFSIGFVFSDDCAAQHEHSTAHGRVYYINPAVINGSKWTKKFRYHLTEGRADLNKLAVYALHELVHGLGFPDHDESYACKLTEMMSILIDHQKELIWCYNKDK
jgi:hypothetical protein